MRLWIQVRDLATTYRTLLERGAIVVRPPRREPWGLNEMSIVDPDGLRIGIIEGPPQHPLHRDPRSYARLRPVAARLQSPPSTWAASAPTAGGRQVKPRGSQVARSPSRFRHCQSRSTSASGDKRPTSRSIMNDTSLDVSVLLDLGRRRKASPAEHGEPGSAARRRSARPTTTGA